jgi:hypothetical protein
VVAVKVADTEEFRRLAVQLKQAGRGDLRRELARAMKEAAAPVVQEAQNRVRSLSVTGVGGGASARAAGISSLAWTDEVFGKRNVACTGFAGLRCAGADRLTG